MTHRSGVGIACSCFLGDVNAARYLIEEKGVSVEARRETKKSRGSLTPLLRACLLDNYPMVRYLVEDQNADVSATDEMEATIVHYLKPSGKVGRYLLPLISAKEQSPTTTETNTKVEEERMLSLRHKLSRHLHVNMLYKAEPPQTILCRLFRRIPDLDRIAPLFWELIRHPDIHLEDPNHPSKLNFRYALVGSDRWYDAVVYLVKERKMTFGYRELFAPFQRQAVDNLKTIRFLYEEVTDLLSLKTRPGRTIEHYAMLFSRKSIQRIRFQI